MGFAPKKKPYGKLTGDICGHSWMYRVWSHQEWSQTAPDQRPPTALTFDAGRVEIVYGDRTDAGERVLDHRVLSVDEVPVPEPIAHQEEHSHHNSMTIPVDSIIADPNTPAVQQFLLYAVREGLVRVMPASSGRIFIIPIAHPHDCGNGASPQGT